MSRVEEVKAEIAELVASGKKNPARLGALRKDLLAALEAENEDLRLTAAFKAPAAGDAPAAPADEAAERAALAQAVVAAHVARHGSASRPLQTLVTAGDSIFDAYQGLKAGGDYETVRTKLEDANRSVARLQRENSSLVSKLQHRDEQLTDYMSRLQLANLPV